MRVSYECADRLHERGVARPESIAPLRRAVVEFAARRGASERQRDDIALAVSEALANAVLHAYVGHDRPGVVDVRAQMRERSLEVVVRDEGNGMLARSDSPGLGVGLSLMVRLTERCDVDSRAPAGVRVRMTFAIG